MIIGGGDTGADCLGTVAPPGRGVGHQFEILPRPPDVRADRQPVAARCRDLPGLLGPRRGRRAGYSVNTERFLGDEDGHVRALVLHEVEMVDGRFAKIEGTDLELPCRLVLPGDGLRRSRSAAVARALGVELTTAATSPATTAS